MPDIVGMVGLLEKLQSRDITIHQNRCVRVRNRNATCHRCADACTSGCLSFAENEVLVDPSKCVGCGTCATVCPTCAIEAHHPNDAELLQLCLAAMEATDGEVVIACNEILKAADGLYDPEKVVGVECLGRVEESLLSTLVVRGAKSIRLVKAKCEECERATGWKTAEAVCDTERELLRVWNADVAVDIADRFPGSVRATGDSAYDHDKRAFFENLRDEGKATAVTAVDVTVKDKLGVEEESEPRLLKVMEDGTLPHHLPDRRERLLDALSALGEPEDEMIDTRLWGHVIINTDICNSCRMCATFCPTGAIWKFDDADGTFGVEHFPGDCVKCRCCEDICIPHALTLSDEVFARDLMTGRTERYTMPKPDISHGGPHSIVQSMKGLIGIDQIYER